MNVEEHEKSRVTSEGSVVVNPIQRRRSWVGALILVVLGAVALAVVIVLGLNARVRASSALKHDTDALAVPTVAVVHPQLSDSSEEIALPGNMQAFVDTPIWARASGYLRKWYADIGTHVEKGQLLAEIEAPELDRQLQQASADLQTAQANFDLAQSTAKRYQFLLKTDSVSKQETDEKVGDLAAKKATVDAMAANLRRLQELQSFEKIYAPFTGVITARNTDTGALIDSGANSPGRELFHEASTNVLRVYVNVPQLYSQAAKPGVNADLTLAEFPGRTFRGRLIRTADSIDVNSRTLLTEVDVSNPSGELLPGAYVSVHLKLPGKTKAMTVPVNTLLFRAEGLQVALVRNNRTQLVPVKMGRDFGNNVEIASGVKADDSLVVNPSDSITSGQQVQVK